MTISLDLPLLGGGVHALPVSETASEADAVGSAADTADTLTELVAAGTQAGGV